MFADEYFRGSIRFELQLLCSVANKAPKIQHSFNLIDFFNPNPTKFIDRYFFVFLMSRVNSQLYFIFEKLQQTRHLLKHT